MAALCAAWLACAAAAGSTALPPSAFADTIPEVVAARFAAPPESHLTPGLQPGRGSYTSDEELAAALRTLAARPGGPRLLAAGRSAQGMAIEALHYTRGPGRPVVLLVGQQHGDEPAGAEALLAVAGLLATPDWVPLLDRVDVIVLPRANPDGAALGLRQGRHGVDINRDHLLLRTPEAQALALLMRAFRPLVLADLHEYPVQVGFRDNFNALQRSDLLLQYATAPQVPAGLTAVSENWFRLPLLQALQGAGLRVDWFHLPPAEAGERRMVMGGLQAHTLRNAQGLRNGIGLLLETRGVGIGRAHLQRRVHSHVVAVNSILRSAADHAGALQALRAEWDAQVIASACRGDVVVKAAQTPTRRDMLMLDPVTGGDKWVAVHWESSLEWSAVIQRTRPCGYWLAAGAGDAVQRLQALGVAAVPLAVDAVLPAESWHEAAGASVVQPDASISFDDVLGGRRVQVVTKPLWLTVATGSWWVPLDQPLAHLAIAALEPDAPGSWYAQRVLPALDSAARVVAVPQLAPLRAGDLARP